MYELILLAKAVSSIFLEQAIVMTSNFHVITSRLCPKMEKLYLVEILN